jgi:hypothetical protein
MKHIKAPVTLRDSETGEVWVHAELTEAKVRKLVKMYQTQGVWLVA